ncbi:MAG: serine hydrolase domain-containing protein [Actinomycetota bacterium]
MDVQGTVESGFEKVADAFRANFTEQGDVGAAFALHVDGELVVDLRGGVADRSTAAPYTDRTLQLVYSTTKGIAAICIGMLVDRGLIDLGAPVAQYWPEFGAEGKEAITVAQMMSHQAGIPAVDVKLTLDEVLAVDPMVEALAAQAPLWEPGTKHGYHAITYGWLVGELVRRIDGRRINQFLQEDICGPLGVEFWIGLPESEDERVAPLLTAAPPTDPEELQLMFAVAGPGTLGARALFLDGLFAPGTGAGFNSTDVHRTEMPAANGITTARSLSRIYAATVAEVDGVRLLSPETVDAMRAEQVNAPDACLVATTRFGAGFMLHGELPPLLGDGSFGHAGAGGSLGYADPETGVGYGYVMNQMGGGIAGDPRTITLNDAVRACL